MKTFLFPTDFLSLWCCTLFTGLIRNTGHLSINNIISQKMHSLIFLTCINIYAYGYESFLVNFFIMNTFSEPWTVYTIQLRYRLLLSGDIETNPGPSIVFKHLTSIFRNNNKRIKFLHVKAQNE